MRKLLLSLSIIAAFTVSSCKENSGNHSGQYVESEPMVVVNPETVGLGESLNLQALGELVKNSSNAETIENTLNRTGSINNLDLDGDGNVDYIKVTEYGSGNTKGFSFTVDLPNSETQEIATVEVNKGASNAQMNIQGNQQIYGASNHYQSSFDLSDLIIMNYLFTSHRPYFSPYRYGYYPSYYHRYSAVPVSSYNSRISSTTRTSTITRTSKPTTSTRSSIKSPNASKTSNTVSQRAKTLSAPTRSQKSFSTTSVAKSTPKTSGFGNSSKSTSSSSSYSTPKKSTSSSFGSSSKSSSSSSSFGSSSSNKRSSSSFGSSSKSSSSSSSRSSSRKR